KQGPCAGQLDTGNDYWIAIDVTFGRRDVGYLDRLHCPRETTDSGFGARSGSVPQFLGISRWRTMNRSGPKIVPVLKPQVAEFGLAEPRCILQYGFKDGVYLARRTADDL